MLSNVMLWEELKPSEFPEALEKSKSVCVIPVGAMEKHGPHMPLGTDNIIAARTACLAAELEPVVIFPTFSFGCVNGIQNLAGSICLSTRLMMDYLDELCREIARSGFKKILFLNAHGGNVYMLPALCDSMREKKRDYVVMYANSYGTSPDTLRKALAERRGDFPYITDEDISIIEKYFERPMQEGHADLDELLLVYESRPDLLDLSAMGNENGESTHRTDFLSEFGLYTGGAWFANYPNQFAASHFPYANERLARAYTQLRVEYIAKMFKTVKEDAQLLAINEEWNNSW